MIFMLHLSPPHEASISSHHTSFSILLSIWIVQLPLQYGDVSLSGEQSLLAMSSVEESLFIHPTNDPTSTWQAVLSSKLNTEPRSVLLCGASMLPFFFFVIFLWDMCEESDISLQPLSVRDHRAPWTLLLGVLEFIIPGNGTSSTFCLFSLTR